MRRFFYIFVFSLFFISYSYAKLDLSKVASAVNSTASSSKFSSNSASVSSLTSNSIDKALNNALNSVKTEIIEKLNGEISKFEKNINKNITDITSKFENEIGSASSKVNGIITKAETITNDIEKQYKSLVAMKDKAVSSGMKIIAMLPMIINCIIYTLIAIVVGFFLMVFFFWRSYRNVKKIARDLIELDLKTKLNNLERKIDSLTR